MTPAGRARPLAIPKGKSVVEARLLNGTILIYGATGYTGTLIAKAEEGEDAAPTPSS